MTGWLEFQTRFAIIRTVSAQYGRIYSYKLLVTAIMNSLPSWRKGKYHTHRRACECLKVAEKGSPSAKSHRPCSGDPKHLNAYVNRPGTKVTLCRYTAVLHHGSRLTLRLLNPWQEPSKSLVVRMHCSSTIVLLRDFIDMILSYHAPCSLYPVYPFPSCTMYLATWVLWRAFIKKHSESIRRSRTGSISIPVGVETL